MHEGAPSLKLHEASLSPTAKQQMHGYVKRIQCTFEQDSMSKSSNTQTPAMDMIKSETMVSSMGGIINVAVKMTPKHPTWHCTSLCQSYRSVNRQSQSPKEWGEGPYVTLLGTEGSICMAPQCWQYLALRYQLTWIPHYGTGHKQKITREQYNNQAHRLL